MTKPVQTDGIGSNEGAKTESESVSSETGGVHPADVYVVDDDPTVCKTLQLAIGSLGKSVRCFGQAEDFLREFDASQAECIVLDLSLPKMNGHELLSLLAERHKTPVVVFSGNEDVQAAKRSRELGAIDFCAKSAGVGALLDCVRKAATLAQGSRVEPPPDAAQRLDLPPPLRP